MDKEKLNELLEKVATLTATINILEQRVEKLETGEKDTGVYLDGCPDYARDYINDSLKDKEGE